MQRPGHRVVDEDVAGADVVGRLRLGHRLVGAAVVGLEQRRLEIHHRASRLQEGVRGLDQLELVGGGFVVAFCAEQVGVLDEIELDGDPPGDLLVAGQRLVDATGGSVCTRQRRLQRQRRRVLSQALLPQGGGAGSVTVVAPRQLTQLVEREALVRSGGGGVQGLLHRGAGSLDVAAQLALVGDAGQRGVARVDVGHLLQRFGSLVVAAQLGQGVGEHAVRRGVEGVDGDRLAG